MPLEQQSFSNTAMAKEYENMEIVLIANIQLMIRSTSVGQVHLKASL